ncbi:MAG: YlxR family protein [Chloroflexota bacterium]|nr:YlxR family protein [Chloroflexota bacterium]
MRTPGREVLLDPSGRMPGRGAYLCADGACWATAVRKGAIERALEAQLPAELRAKLQSGDLNISEGVSRGT